MRKILSEKFLMIFILSATFGMIVIRFLLNEKGRVSPDSIRFMRQAKIFPVIDNTTAPLGYPLALKTISLFGLDYFWASKILGISVYLFMVYFTWKKKYYFKEFLISGALFSYVSIFSFTLSEVFILPFLLLFLYYSEEIIRGRLPVWQKYFSVIILLIVMYNIRYSALFLMGGCFLFGVFNFREKFGRYFFIGGLSGMLFMLLYQLFFVGYYNPDYYSQFLEITQQSTQDLVVQLFLGLCTTFNPFIHIADPGGRSVNYAIYAIGFLNICFLFYFFIKYKLNRAETYFLYLGTIGILASFFIQYFYVVDGINYRLLSPFVFPVWLVYFKKLFQNFGKWTFIIALASLATGFAFTLLSSGNYLENRKNMEKYLTEEDLLQTPIKFYMKSEEDLTSMQLAELISTINPVIYVTTDAKDSLQIKTLTKFKIRQKIKLDENKYQ